MQVSASIAEVHFHDGMELENLLDFMQLKNLLKQKLMDFSYLTMSGEINVSCKSYNAIIINDSGLISRMKSYVKALNDRYPKLKIQLQTGISEISIKVFAYRKMLMNNCFLEEMRINLAGLLISIYENNDLQAKLNIRGFIDSYRGRKSFIFMNNEQEVKYEVIQFEPNNSIISKMNFFINRKCDDM
jgi:hypothetical protein